LFLVAERAPQLDQVTQAIRAALLAPPGKAGLSSQQIAEKIGLSARAIRSRMTVLGKRGLVTAVGTSSRDPQRKYYSRS
jgi:predicted ArsR family transcriptional regulator